MKSSFLTSLKSVHLNFKHAPYFYFLFPYRPLLQDFRHWVLTSVKLNYLLNYSVQLKFCSSFCALLQPFLLLRFDFLWLIPILFLFKVGLQCLAITNLRFYLWNYVFYEDKMQLVLDQTFLSFEAYLVFCSFSNWSCLEIFLNLHVLHYFKRQYYKVGLHQNEFLLINLSCIITVLELGFLILLVLFQQLFFRVYLFLLL